MIYELRVYHCVPGRLPDLLKRFDTITLKIWERHGIQQAGFWTVLVGESNQALYYLLKFDSLADREKKWNTFQADPEWHSGARRDREERPDRRQGRQLVPAADQLLGGEVADSAGRAFVLPAKLERRRLSGPPAAPRQKPVSCRSAAARPRAFVPI